jgi:hypothetical protein
MGWFEEKTGIDLTIDELSKPVNQAVEAVREVGRDIDDFVNEEIPGGWYTVGAIAGGTYLANAGAAGAGTAGATAGTAEAAAATGAFDAGVGGIAEAMGAGAAGGGAALGTGLTAGATGEGLVAPTVPSLSSMGGGTGLVTEASGGGLLSAGGVTAAGAVPVLGSSGSFINNPAVLGTDVIGAQQGGISVKQALDALRAGNTIRNLLGQEQPQIPNMLGRNQMPQGSVDYSQYLNLLAQRPRRADITTLLG